MGLFGKRDSQDVAAIEQTINELAPYTQPGYTLTAVAGRGGMTGRKVTLELDFTTPAASARFLRSDFESLCHGSAQVIEPVGDAPPMFFATPESGTPGSLAFDALVGVPQGAVALLKPDGEAMKALLVLSADELAAIGRWLEALPSVK